jgi:CobQ-like glutamine amidotransferase family enzyme
MEQKSYKLTITHFYPKHMNIYGDVGNIITLVKRCEWRGIHVDMVHNTLGEKLPQETDIYFMGGGQDDDQIKVFKDLLKKKKLLIKQIEEGVAFLGICGAFQLLGRYFLTGEGERIEGIGLLDIETKAPDTKVKSRCIGNVVAKLNADAFDTKKMLLDTIVGFENHSGQTYLGKNVKPLAYVVKGYGNNIEDNSEGGVYKNLIGTYLHGSFLPKNPHIADWLISKALRRKYGRSVSLKELDDVEELNAHNYILENK